MGLKLSADLVILSACNTASGDGTGADAVSGLGRAFLHAGANSLLVSHWAVHSQSTMLLMTEVFEALARDPLIGRARAVQQARLSLIDEAVMGSSSSPLFSYAHPIFWGAFELIGEGSVR